MLGLDAKPFQHALGIVGSQAGGLMAAQEGAMVKRFHCGPRGAERRLFGAARAQRISPASPTCSKRRTAAISRRYSDEPNPPRLTAGLGTTWETLQVGYKPHASVTSIHTALDGLGEIMREHEARGRRHRARRDGPLAR